MSTLAEQRCADLLVEIAEGAPPERERGPLYAEAANWLLVALSKTSPRFAVSRRHRARAVAALVAKARAAGTPCDALDCCHCSGCCSPDADDFLTLQLAYEEATRLITLNPQCIEERLQDGVQTWWMRAVVRGGRKVCPVLNGTPGFGRSGCTIYEDRPQMCRELPVGEDCCLLAIRRNGEPAEGAFVTPLATEPDDSNPAD